jgi:hypothetical protein
MWPVVSQLLTPMILGGHHRSLTFIGVAEQGSPTSGLCKFDSCRELITPYIFRIAADNESFEPVITVDVKSDDRDMENGLLFDYMYGPTRSESEDGSDEDDEQALIHQSCYFVSSGSLTDEMLLADRAV